MGALSIAFYFNAGLAFIAALASLSRGKPHPYYVLEKFSSQGKVNSKIYPRSMLNGGSKQTDTDRKSARKPRSAK
jgi:hypothetical protein